MQVADSLAAVLLSLPRRMSDDIELPSIPAGSLLEEIDAQQDDLLRQLDELNDRLECLLRECAPAEARPLTRAA